MLTNNISITEKSNEQTNWPFFFWWEHRSLMNQLSVFILLNLKILLPSAWTFKLPLLNARANKIIWKSRKCKIKAFFVEKFRKILKTPLWFSIFWTFKTIVWIHSTKPLGQEKCSRCFCFHRYLNEKFVRTQEFKEFGSIGVISY